MQGEVMDIRVAMARATESADREASAPYRVLAPGPKRTVPELFEEQVVAGPERIAIRTHRGEITYDELNRYANRIAHTLVDRLGADQEAVALGSVENIGLLAAMLGVMKANKFLVTLSPLDPVDRQAQMVKRSEARMLIVDDLWATEVGLGEVEGVETLRLTDIDPNISDENLGLDIDPDSWRHRACAVANRTLTREEWKEFLPGRRYEPACAT